MNVAGLPWSWLTQPSRIARRAAIAIVMLASLVPSLPLGAQTTAGTGAAIELYRFSDSRAISVEQLMLLTIPLAAQVYATPRLTLSLSGAWARGALQRDDGSEATISGPTDTELRAAWVFGNDAVTLSAIALLPTGHEKLDAAEAEIAGAIAADVLPFRITNWGTGGGVGASLAAAFPLGEFAGGLSAGYVLAREFEPVADDASFAYRPGNQLHLTAAVDRTIAGSSKASLRVSYLTFNADRANNQNLYQSGDRVQATASLSFAAGPRSTGIAWGGFLHRASGEFVSSSQINPGQDLFFAGASGRIPFGRGIVQPGLDLRVVSGSSDTGRGYTASAGLGAEVPYGRTSVGPTLRLRYGSVEPRPGSKSAFVGVDAGLMVRFGNR
jgi:hypothetical protein